MIFKTYTDSSLMLKEVAKLEGSINSITIYYDAEFDEYKFQLFIGAENESWYIKTVKGHVKVYKSMKSVYTDISLLLQEEEVPVNLLFDK